METTHSARIPWKENADAVELGFDFYVGLLERRLEGEKLSLVQNLRRFYKEELGIDLRETQARGLMHKASSVFIDYVKNVSGHDFVPGVQFWEDVGIEKFLQWRDAFYHARKKDAVAADVEEELLEKLESLGQEEGESPSRRQVVVNRIIRDSALSRFLKALYQSQCQICTRSFGLPNGGKYAESHHLRPLGKTHAGIDKETNMMVLCPNHHAMMDFGVIAVHPEKLILQSINKSSWEHNSPVQLMRHRIEREFLEYHLSSIFNKVL